MSMLKLRWRQHCPLALDFHGQRLKVIDRDGQPWFTGETIGKALGYADPGKGIRKLYERNKRQFGPRETALVEMEVEVSEHELRGQFVPATHDHERQSDAHDRVKRRGHTRSRTVRIYSLRGCNLLGILADTEVGDQFRQWVLDLIEHRHEEDSWYAAYRNVVRALCEKHSTWERIHYLFTLGTPIKDIAREMKLHRSTVSRALRAMRGLKLLTERDYQWGLEEGRKFAAIKRKIIKERQADWINDGQP
jgi:prophage antirepressor-like protein